MRHRVTIQWFDGRDGVDLHAELANDDGERQSFYVGSALDLPDLVRLALDVDADVFPRLFP